MANASHTYAFDHRLLTIEELFRQRQYGPARQQLDAIGPDEFSSVVQDVALITALRAEASLSAGEYRRAIEQGLQAVRLFADLPFDRRYGRVQFVLAKSYSALGDLKNADLRGRDALSAYRRIEDALGQVDALNELAHVAFIRSDFSSAISLLDDAQALCGDDLRKQTLIKGNLARIRILTGEWPLAETGLKEAVAYNLRAKEEQSLALNLLSLGYLALRRRDFAQAVRNFEQAAPLIQKLDLKREKVILLEYQSELACERMEMHRAKGLGAEAYHQGRLLAPESALVSQSARRLAEADLALDNFDDAMKYGQKALELARQIGERAELGLALRTVAQVYAARGEREDALEHIRQSVDLLRQLGDPYDLARTLVVMGDIKSGLGADLQERVRASYDEAARIFKRLKLEYWSAECDFRLGMFLCRQNDLGRGFKRISRAEKTFTAIGDRTRLRTVQQFLMSLVDQAVALSLSDRNEFKLFGNWIAPAQIKQVPADQLDVLVSQVKERAGAYRAVLYLRAAELRAVIGATPLSQFQQDRFAIQFDRLIGEEISAVKPVLLFDCRRDPHLNGLIPDQTETVASVMVLPIRNGEEEFGYLYLDRITLDGSLNPFGQTELNFAVGFADIVVLKVIEWQRTRLQEDNRRLKAQLAEKSVFPSIITASHELRQILTQVRQIIDSPISICIEGETGCGKDLLARAIHFNSIRREKRFMSVNCAALPESLLESELFGYKRGAFTGADRDKVGLFEEANGGTFFFDEVADMPLSIQAKVLRVIEEKEVVRLGDTVPRKVDVRILSATNKDLKDQMAAGLFRQDLYYRLSALTYRLPSLRERVEDIPLLVEHFLQESGKKVTPEVLKALMAYDWPGNIRELENEVKKLVLLSGDNPLISADNLSTKIVAAGKTDATPAPSVSTTTVAFGDRYSLYDYLADWEKKFILQALREHHGIKKHAAAALNIPESTLRLKIKQYDINLHNLDAA